MVIASKDNIKVGHILVSARYTNCIWPMGRKIIVTKVGQFDVDYIDVITRDSSYFSISRIGDFDNSSITNEPSSHDRLNEILSTKISRREHVQTTLDQMKNLEKELEQLNKDIEIITQAMVMYL